jgi:hypothetical protein
LDFTASKETGIGSVASQWRDAVATGPLVDSRARMIVATQTPNGTVRSLRDALARRRGEIAGGMSGPEAEAMCKLEKHLASLNRERQDSVLNAVRVWELKVEDEDDTGSDIGRLLLRGVLADEAEATSAWRDLVADCKYLARVRQGRSRAGFVERLRELGYTLKPDPPGSDGARRSAVGRYRQRIIRRGRTLDFLGLGAARRFRRARWKLGLGGGARRCRRHRARVGAPPLGAGADIRGHVATSHVRDRVGAAMDV